MPGRFRDACYRAANWQLLGFNTGRGKNDHTNKPNRPIKEVRYATFIITTPGRESRQCRRNSGCASIRITVSR